MHIIGAGLSGLSAAVELATAGRKVAVYEAAKFAGGRCRTYYDSVIDLEIDNGNHLLLSGNRAALSYLREIGGLSAMTEAASAAFPFVDIKTGERWTLRPNDGRLPWWIFEFPPPRARHAQRPTISRRSAFFARAADATVGNAMACRGPLYDRLWRPVLLAALNTEPAEADARLAAQILRETLAAGGQACRPMVATGGLSAAFIDPALAYLERPRRRSRISAARSARSPSRESGSPRSSSGTIASQLARRIRWCWRCRRSPRARSFQASSCRRPSTPS